jgi:hypothetical protein
VEGDAKTELSTTTPVHATFLVAERPQVACAYVGGRQVERLYAKPRRHCSTQGGTSRPQAVEEAPTRAHVTPILAEPKDWASTPVSDSSARDGSSHRVLGPEGSSKRAFPKFHSNHSA